MKAKQLIKHFASMLNNLQDLDIPFLITGTVAINLQGISLGREPEDLDIVTNSNYDFEKLGFENIWDGDNYPENAKEDLNQSIYQLTLKGEKLNILVIPNGKALSIPSLEYIDYPLEPLGECLNWKLRLLRNKDLKDLEYIKQNYLTFKQIF